MGHRTSLVKEDGVLTTAWGRILRQVEWRADGINVVVSIAQVGFPFMATPLLFTERSGSF